MPPFQSLSLPYVLFITSWVERGSLSEGQDVLEIITLSCWPKMEWRARFRSLSFILLEMCQSLSPVRKVQRDPEIVALSLSVIRVPMLKSKQTCPSLMIERKGWEEKISELIT
jgi:hypothetical protein